MFCRNCGAEMDPNAAVCLKCGVSKGKGDAFCMQCGKPTNANQAVCLGCGCKITGGGSGGLGGSGGVLDGFTRVAEGKLISGVCAGLGRKWNASPWIIRLAFIFLPLWPVWLAIYIYLTKYPME